MDRCGRPYPALLALVACAAVSLAHGQESQGLPGDEGPLDNDCFLPTARAAEEHLARGDLVYGRLVGEARWAADEERAWVEVFEAWRAALVDSEPGESVAPRPTGGAADAVSPWPDPDGTAGRRTEGVEWAVQRRLTALSPDRRALWSERFETLAGEALAAAGTSVELLAEAERQHPATLGATRAAVRLADLAFEEGRADVGRGWLERAAGHLTLVSVAPEQWAEHLRARNKAFADLSAALRGGRSGPQAWETATNITPLTASAIVDQGRGRVSQLVPRPGVGIQPGICFLDDGTAAIQASERVILIEPEDGNRVAQFAPTRLIETAPWAATNPPARFTAPPGWPLRPATDGRALVLVQGRAAGLQRNVVMCIDFEESPEPIGESQGPLLPKLRWALMEGWIYTGKGPPRPSGLDLESPEFQPGPLLVGSQVLVQVRERSADATPDTVTSAVFRTESEIGSWVVALDLATGEPRWKRFVAKGVSLSRGQGRFGTPIVAVSSAQPLVAAGGRVFAGTHIGAGVLLDVTDGRVGWSLLNRRRPEEGTGWCGARPIVTSATGSILWTPADGDHAYWLRARPGPGSNGPLLHPPRHIGEAIALVGGGAGEAVVLARSGRERTLSGWNAETGGRFDAPYLGPGEDFTGYGLASESRALFATDRGLYLLDRERELYLIDYAPLRRNPGPNGGSVFAHGDRIYVLGPTSVWIFAAS